jgi:HEAT repeat protein
MRCGSKTVYLAPGKKVSLATHQLVAVVDGERRRLWSRSAVKALLADPSGWDGSCEVVAADGTTRRVRLDARIVDGHLPDNARWWRISQLDQARGGGGSSAALLEQVGGARQLAELLFGEPNRRAGRVAAEAVCAGRGGQVSAVACAAGLISADDAANILEQCAEVPWAKWFTPFDPDGDGAVIAATLAMTAPEHRVRILTGWLTSLPAGLTPELVADLAGDDAFAEALCGQGSLGLVAALLSVRGDLPEGAARALRGRDLVTLARQGSAFGDRNTWKRQQGGWVSVVDLAAAADDPLFTERVAAAAAEHLHEQFGSADDDARRYAAESLGEFSDAPEAVRMLEAALADEHYDVRVAAACSLAAFSDAPEAVRMLEAALADEDYEVREAAALNIAAFSDAPEAVRVLEAAFADENDDVRMAAAHSLDAFSDAPEAIRMLEAAFADEYSDVRESAARSLAAFAAVPGSVRMLEAAFADEDKYVRVAAALNIGAFAAAHPGRARELQDLLPPGRLDPEEALKLASTGIPVSDPFIEDFRSVVRAARSGSQAVEDVKAARTFDDVIAVGGSFPTEAALIDSVETSTWQIGGETLTPRVIRSRSELNRNAEAMGNCTSGYASRLNEGDAMVAFSGPDGTPRFNAHIEATNGGWRVGEVNSRRNAGGTDCEHLSAKLQSVVAELQPAGS